MLVFHLLYLRPVATGSFQGQAIKVHFQGQVKLMLVSFEAFRNLINQSGSCLKLINAYCEKGFPREFI